MAIEDNGKIWWRLSVSVVIYIHNGTATLQLEWVFTPHLFIPFEQHLFLATSSLSVSEDDENILYKLYFLGCLKLSFKFCVIVFIVAWMCLYSYLLFDTRMCFRSVRQTQLANSIAALLLSSFRLRPQLFLPQTYNQQKNKSAIFLFQILGVSSVDSVVNRYLNEELNGNNLKLIWKSSAEEAEKIDQVLDIPAASFSVIWLLMGASGQRNLVRDLENVGGRNQQSEMKQRVGQSCQNAWGRSCALGCFCSQVTS